MTRTRRHRIRTRIFLAISLGVLASVAAREGTAQEIDASKPTNFYPLLGNNIEYASRDSGGDLFGYRAELIYPPNERWLFLAELPILHNSETDKTGLGDSRLRAFWLPYKNYDRFFGAFGPSIDATLPTGKYEDGLGSSAWTVSIGVTGALMLADWIQTFPILSFVHTGKPTTDLIPESQKQESQGMSLQAITPVVFSENFFAQITPILSVTDVNDDGTARYIQELLLAYSLTPTLQLSGFWRGAFKDEEHTLRLGLTVFFVDQD